MSREWSGVFPDVVKKDILRLDVTLRAQVLKVILRVAKNPLPQVRGGYGKPLGGNLSGLFKIKLRRAGVRVVYALREIDGKMVIVVVGVRDGETVYSAATKRRGKLGL